MAYLRWLDSSWYAYRHADGGQGAEAVLSARHGSGFDLWATAAELSSAKEAQDGREGQWLHRFMAARPGCTEEALADATELRPAVDEFLREVFLAGLVPMPVETARRYRILCKLIRRRVQRPLAADKGSSCAAEFERDELPEEALLRLRKRHPEWAWVSELCELDRQYPRAAIPDHIRTLERDLARRALAGDEASAEQDALDRARIKEAYEAWPPVAPGQPTSEPAGTIGTSQAGGGPVASTGPEA